MDSDRIKGQARSAVGTVEERYGRLANDPDITAEGLARQASGRAQTGVGQAKDALRDQAERATAYAEGMYDRSRRAAEEGAQVLNARIESNPVMAIVIAGALGYLIGIMARRARR